MKACCEFSRKLQISQIQKKPLMIKIEADEEEKKALAERFSIPKLHSLCCIYQLKYYHGRQVRAKGEIKALITQNCVISLEDFFVTIHESFELHFIPNDDLKSELEEIDDPDIIPYEGEVIDLGEVTAEQLALFLDPYPHKEISDNPLIINDNDEDINSTERVKENPFKVLEQLKKLNSDKKK
ncbi:DUF177 domain-containing protein [Commensalibacter papalotli (ex Botero et al. 2024)]|uniref:Uncharacterized in bacteria (YceD (PUBMED:27574185 n=1 Tax=Commensalibacter papalotli (ex Botero et al. 2024) TaxID=2972766 RepID=A0ABM9HQK9_9PROT|nr:DUF177 domain-containing protein [Commensalibacter papalotli (ex Botero et al. 2024)]CAI3930743.1 23S rRNA accumulation protein YceD (essential in plants [Commensalibacter papalotli (ex Botero et al. 2024)]CAI3944937.1 23S rRNA accumulation protein YceD (essential in plants [Commensalibacter papalotli (ex Botero et al. 2024)]